MGAASATTEHVDLAEAQESNWVDPTTCLFNVVHEETKISTIIKVFSNRQVLVTLTDNDKFGSTFSAKKVPLDGGAGGVDPTAMMLYGMGGSATAFDLDDDLDDMENEGGGAGGGGGAAMPRDTIEAHLLLGDRKSQEVGELLTMNLFKMIEDVPKFAGLEGMVLQVSLAALRSQEKALAQKQADVKAIIELLKTKLTQPVMQSETPSQ